MKKHTLKSQLKTKLTKKQLSQVLTSYSIIGDIAIIEIPKELLKKEKIIAETLLKTHRNIKTVYKKSGIHKGRFRTQKLKFVKGEKNKETIHKENDIKLKLDIEKVYFSPRLSTERKRIAQQIKPNENILAMFSGCGPYPLVILNFQPNLKKIISIELNPEAVKYQKENIILNKAIAKRIKGIKDTSKKGLIKTIQKKIQIHKGDVKTITPRLKQKFDRILMPLPKSAEDFLPTALNTAKKHTIIHFYDFLHEDEFNTAKEKITKACEKAKKKFKIITITRCGQHAPRTYRICVDFEIL